MRLLNRSAGRLSRHRRGPLAGLVVLLFGLLLTGGLYAAFSPASAEKTGTDAEQIAEGRKLFLTSCSFCHGQNGEGITTQKGNQLGPSLIGVGAAAVDFQIGTGRMPLTQTGVQTEPKQNVFTEEESDAIEAYVASLGPGPGVPAEADYSTEGLSEEEREELAVRGGQIFLTNCSACHNFAGEGGAMPRGKVAPSITDTDPKHIYEAMLTGPGEMDNFSNGNIPPEDKKAVIAYLQALEENPDYGGFGMGAVGPVSEGMFAWLVGIGGCVAFAYWIASHTTRTDKQKPQAANGEAGQ